MKSFNFSLKRLPSFFFTLLVLSFNPSVYAQNNVDVTSGVCEDSACSRSHLAAPQTSNSNSSTSVAAANICHPSSVANTAIACGYGFSGTKFTTTTVTCVKGAYGGKTTTVSGYDTSSCIALPVTCTESSRTGTGSCGSGYSGTKYRDITVTCPSGPYGSSSTVTGSWDTSACEAVVVAPPVTTPPVTTPPVTTPPVTPPNVTCTAGSWANAAVSCGSGATGTMFTTTVQTCPAGSYGSPSTNTGGYDVSGCGCANGGTNYPTCTPPAPPPEPPVSQCTFTQKWSIPRAAGIQKCSLTTTRCCAGVCTSDVEYGQTGSYSGMCTLN